MKILLHQEILLELSVPN